MIINHHKEKAYHAATFFLNNIPTCSEENLRILLYAFDFEHYRQTGRSVTNLNYEAWTKGETPAEILDAIKNKNADICESFNEKFFSKRQLKLLQDIASK